MSCNKHQLQVYVSNQERLNIETEQLFKFLKDKKEDYDRNNSSEDLTDLINYSKDLDNLQEDIVRNITEITKCEKDMDINISPIKIEKGGDLGRPRKSPSFDIHKYCSQNGVGCGTELCNNYIYSACPKSTIKDIHQYIIKNPTQIILIIIGIVLGIIIYLK
jgi:hypothetical protein